MYVHTQAIQCLSLPVSSHHTSLPEQYAGDVNHYRNFLRACESYFSEHPEPMDGEKITTLITRLTRVAREWVLVMWRRGGTRSSCYSEFVEEFMVVFDHPEPDSIQNRSEGSGEEAEYAVFKWCSPRSLLTKLNGWLALTPSLYLPL